MRKREIQGTERALHTIYTEGNCYIVKKESNDWPMVIQPVSGWTGTGIQYPDFQPKAFAKFKFCLESRFDGWPGNISISSTMPLQNDSAQGTLFESFFPSAQSTRWQRNTFSFSFLKANVLGKQWWFTSLVDSTRRWDPGEILHSPHLQKQQLLPEDSSHATVILR